VNDPAETTHGSKLTEAAEAAADGAAANHAVASAASAQKSSYDAVPYSVSAFAQTRPDRLAAIATLFGMQPAPPDQCRAIDELMEVKRFVVILQMLVEQISVGGRRQHREFLPDHKLLKLRHILPPS
jgi:hypothetical protein